MQIFSEKREFKKCFEYDKSSRIGRSLSMTKNSDLSQRILVYNSLALNSIFTEISQKSYPQKILFLGG